MDMSTISQMNLASLRNALGMSILQKSMGRDQQTVDLLVQGMQDMNRQALENSVQPHLGSFIDLTV